MRRNVATILTVLTLLGLSVPMTGCGAEPSQTEQSENQTATVQRGDITVEITAAGNLALSTTEDLTFDLFYQEGTVEEVLVEEGDTVEEGQVLARLDMEEWEDHLGTLKDQVTAKGRDLVQAQINLQTAEQNLKNTQDTEGALELALSNAQIDVRTVKFNLEQTSDLYTWSDIKTAKADVDDAQRYVDELLEKVGLFLPEDEYGNYPTIQEYVFGEDFPKGPGYEGWQEELVHAQSRLNTAKDRLDAMLSNSDPEEVAIAKLQVEVAEMTLAQAEESLNDVAKDVALKGLQLTLSQGKLVDAKKALVDAQEELEEANSKSPIIEAPFDGFITTVNVEGGDEVMTGTIAVQLADPNKFEADILVSEMDILQAKLGGEAWVQVDAMSGLTLPAKVTHISPTATIQSGVVNYKVKVEVQSLATMQEQAGEMMRQARTMMLADFQLREGLTVTVSIIVDEATDVLLVSNAAITTSGRQSYVQVQLADGATEERTIQTGISNWQYTEVTEGLSEGEQIIVPQGTATTEATTNQGQEGGIGIPGMGLGRQR